MVKCGGIPLNRPRQAQSWAWVSRADSALDNGALYRDAVLPLPGGQRLRRLVDHRFPDDMLSAAGSDVFTWKFVDLYGMNTTSSSSGTASWPARRTSRR
jgi:hypothetical protein